LGVLSEQCIQVIILVSDKAIHVLKRDVKLQPTNQQVAIRNMDTLYHTSCQTWHHIWQCPQNWNLAYMINYTIV